MSPDALVARLSSGLAMHYEESGAGEPLILHYGTGGGHGPWQPQVAGLSSEFRVIAPDPRGTGRTGGTAKEWTIALLATDLVELMDSLGIERAHLAGMSMGASVCQEVAIRYPERVRTLVLANTWGRTDTRLRLIWEHSIFLMEQAGKAALDETARWAEAQFDNVISTFFSSHALEHRRDLIDDWWALYAADLREETGTGHLRAMLAHDALDRLATVRAPTLVLAGEEDYFTQYYPRQVHARIPGAAYKLLLGPGSSHGLLWERADESNALIRDFLLDRRSAG
jgi:pimeloyl-ACP methyl ester carboxylesterase